MQRQPRSCHLDLDLDPMEHDINHPAGPRPLHQNELSNSVANITPLLEAHITQKNKLRPTSEVCRWRTPHPDSVHPERGTHTDMDGSSQNSPRSHPNHTTTTPTPPRQFDPMDYEINFDEVSSHPPDTSGLTPPRRKPIIQTPQNTQPTINPETRQTLRQSNTTHTHTQDAAGPRAGAEHTTGVGVRPSGPIQPSQRPYRKASFPKAQPDCHASPQQAGRSVPSTPSTSAQHEPTTLVPADTKLTINFKIDQAQYLPTTPHPRDATGPLVGAEHTQKDTAVLNTLKG